jgi:hypothetical protein
MSRRWDTDEELTRALSALQLPIEPQDVTAAVSRRIAQGPQALRTRDLFTIQPRGRRVIVVALAILVIGATIAAGTKVVFGAIEIRETDAPIDTTTALPETGPNLGRPTTVEAASAAVGFDVLMPDELGEPDGVFIDDDASHVSLTWLPEERLSRIPGTSWGAILMEFGGDDELAMKTASIDGAEWVDEGGIRGYWLADAHVLQLADGTLFRVDGNVLLFQSGGTTMRLESGLDQAAAIRLAASIS